MIQKKICLLGGHAVGKTSLVARYLRSIFSDKYHTTIGVKIDRKTLSVGEQDVTLMIWDLAGEDEFREIEITYLRGASGYLIVVDGTRRSTLDTALSIQKRAARKVGDVPFVLLINKADLADRWELSDTDLQNLTALGWRIFQTSAKTGEFVETAFKVLTEAMIKPA